MSESRGAASVTLDTIIANALVGALGTGLSDLDRETWSERSAPIARAVTDALLAKGHLVRRCETLIHAQMQDGEITGLLIPLEAS